ncbi:MAG: tRNA cytidylyltransferase [Deltaproteobacteria bacterium]|nr:tRNA cytidylyltransferase [Deltaproteobacteria bacterium]
MSKALRKSAVPAAVLGVLERLEEVGHEAFLVGGAVRDLLLGRGAAQFDWDVATSARPEAVIEAFRRRSRVIPTGLEHGTVTVLAGEARLHVEVTTYRGEAGYSDGRRPDAVAFLERIEDDLSRRDFTVNALAWSPLRDELRDPFGGQADLAAGVLRAVGDPVRRFGEDGLRPLRAVRFAAVLGFTVEEETLAAIPGSLPVYDRVAVERLAQELKKLLLGPEVARGLALLFETGLWRRLVPGEAAADEAEGRALFLERASLGTLPAEELARWAGFLAPAGPDRAREVLEGLRLSRALQREVGTVLEAHQLGAPGPQDGPSLRRRLAVLAGQPGALEPLCEALAALLASEGAGEAAGALRAELARRPPLVPGDLALSGREVMALLGVRGGPVVGQTVRALLAWVLEDPARNTPEALRARVEESSTGGLQ